MNEKEKRITVLESELEQLEYIRSVLEMNPEHLKDGNISEVLKGVKDSIAKVTYELVGLKNDIVGRLTENQDLNTNLDYQKGYLAGLRESVGYIDTLGRGRAVTTICHNIRTVEDLIKKNEEKVSQKVDGAPRQSLSVAEHQAYLDGLTAARYLFNTHGADRFSGNIESQLDFAKSLLAGAVETEKVKRQLVGSAHDGVAYIEVVRYPNPKQKVVQRMSVEEFLGS